MRKKLTIFIVFIAFIFLIISFIIQDKNNDIDHNKNADIIEKIEDKTTIFEFTDK